MLGQKPLAIGPNVLKEEIAEGDRRYSTGVIGGKSLSGLGFILLVGRAFRDVNLMKRQAKAGGLLFKQNAPDTMHADSVVIARYRREQGFNARIRQPHNLMQRHATVFAPTPGDQDRFLLGFVLYQALQSRRPFRMS